VVAVIAVVLAVALRKRDHVLAVGAAWAILPPLALFLVAQGEPMFWVGYVLPALPGVMLLLGVAATRLPRPLAFAAPLALAAIFLVRAVREPNYYDVHGAQPAARALEVERHGSPVVFDIPAGLGAVGFYDRGLAPHGRLVESEWGDRAPPGVTLLDDPGGYGHAPSGPPTPTLISRLQRKTGTEFLLFTETARQGDVLKAPGLLWAKNNCFVGDRWEGGFQVVRISKCRRTA
jgi:hypothetical protein